LINQELRKESGGRREGIDCIQDTRCTAGTGRVIESRGL
jgi:hypothetical protein